MYEDKMMYEEYYDEIDESYYEGEPEGNVMLTEEQQKALDKTLEDVKKSMVEDLKKRSLIDYMKEGREVASYKRRKEELENRLKEKENKINDLDYEIRNREYDISVKEKALAKKEEGLQANYNKAIENYSYDAGKVLRELLKCKLSTALKNFTFPKFYKLGYEWWEQKKCSLCDDNRKRHFTDDLGKSYEVDCPCKTNAYIYKVEEVDVQFKLSISPGKIKDMDSVDEILNDSILVSSGTYDLTYENFLKNCFNPKIETAQEYKEKIGYGTEYFTSIEDAEIYCKFKQELKDKESEEYYMDLKLDSLLVQGEN